MTPTQQSRIEEHLLVTRPGETGRALPRWDFGLYRSGRCGATLTYPIPGYPWRRNPTEHVEATLDESTASRLFEEVATMPAIAPSECLMNEDCWADASEKANSITRDLATNTVCLTFVIRIAFDKYRCHYSMRETSPSLMKSNIMRVVNDLIAPYLDLYRDGRRR